MAATARSAARFPTSPRRALAVVPLAALVVASGACASARGGGAGEVARDETSVQRGLASAPIQDVRYEITYDERAARRKQLAVTMRFAVAGPGAVLLSLPAWTPGAYEVTNFARFVEEFTATGDGRALDWDKVDYDTWRVQPGGARQVVVQFAYVGSDFDNAKTWLKPDFAFFNGTNVFLYPEGRPLDFASRVAIRTTPTWKVATGMPRAADGEYSAASYHELVDYPVFVGRIDVDSVRVGSGWSHVASYPQGALSGGARSEFHLQVAKVIPEQARVFGGPVPWGRDYTTLLVFDEDFGGGSALEHANSHLGIYTPQVIGNPIFTSITAHEIFHAWNVKRLRPADMVPYRYDVAQPTTLLWVSEGITDYYADLSLVRTGIIPDGMFYGLTAGKIDEVAGAPSVALEDASLTSWISPVDGTASIYYPKGSLAGFMLDVLIRDASDNRRGLDDVMRELYRTTYAAGGRGFTDAQFWAAASRAANGKSFADFQERYVDGREAYPWATILPLAGLRLRADTSRFPVLGVSTEPDSAGVVVTEIVPESVAERAGVQLGDYLVSVGEIPVSDNLFGARFRQRYASQGGKPLPIVVRRDGKQQTLTGTVSLSERVQHGIVADAGASPKAVRIRNGILKGTTDGAPSTATK